MIKNKEFPRRRILRSKQFRDELKKKLREEVEELIASEGKEKLIAEIADVYEILNCLLRNLNVSVKDIEVVRKRKLQKYGTFKEDAFLEWVETDIEKFIVSYMKHKKEYPEIKR